MILQLTQCNSYIIIYQFQLSKFTKGEVFMISLLAQCNSSKAQTSKGREIFMISLF